MFNIVQCMSTIKTHHTAQKSKISSIKNTINHYFVNMLPFKEMCLKALAKMRFIHEPFFKIHHRRTSAFKSKKRYITICLFFTNFFSLYSAIFKTPFLMKIYFLLNNSFSVNFSHIYKSCSVFRNS